MIGETALTEDGRVSGLLLAQSLLAGVVIAVVGFGGGGALRFAAGAAGPAAVAVTTTLCGALAAGLWAGSSGGGPNAPRELSIRWRLVALAVTVGGIAATVLGALPVPPSGIGWQVGGLVLTVGGPAYALGYLFPALVAWGEADEDDDILTERDAVGIAVLGVLAGVAVGAVMVVYLLIPAVSVGPLLLASAGACIVPTLTVHANSMHLRQDIERRSTPHGDLRVRDILRPGRGQPERHLLLEGEVQSGELLRSGAPSLRYMAAIEAWLREADRTGGRYLFLGGGAYTLPRRVAEADPTANVAVVERDPELVGIAERFFSLPADHRLRITHGDARAVLEDGPDDWHDFVVLDVYDGRGTLPGNLTTREAFLTLKRYLTPDGALCINLIGELAGPASVRFRSVVRTLANVFPSVALYPHIGADYPEPQNVIVIAAPDAEYRIPARVGSFFRWPREAWPGWGGAIVYRDREQASAAVAGD